MFSGTRGRQIAGRFASVDARPFANGTTIQRQEWGALVATLEQALCLHRLPEGRLLCHADYLHQRSGGMIGSLAHLVREAAVEAILDGTETITKASLGRVRLDHAAEHQEHARPALRGTSARAGSRR